MSLKISIIASLLIIGITNFLGTNEWLTLGQLVRICSLLAGTVVGASIYAVRTIKKADRESWENERHFCAEQECRLS